jgi:hypothetical protein
MKGEKRIEFDRATVETLTKKTLADAAIRVFGEPGPGEEVRVEFTSWGSSSAEIRTILTPEPTPVPLTETGAAVPHAVPQPDPDPYPGRVTLTNAPF